MKARKSLIQVVIVTTILCLMVSPANATNIGGFGGSVSSAQFNQGEEVRFTGSVYNFYQNPLYLVTFNVSFVERLGSTATRDPENFNLSRTYDEDRRELGVNATYTDVMNRKIDFEPGAYRVTIFFEYSNSSQIGSASVFGQLYSLINQTVTILGTTQAVEVARVIGYILLGSFIMLVAYIIYNSKFKN